MKHKLATAVALAVIAALAVAAQATAHFQSPSNNKRLKHDLKHLDGYVTNLVGNSFVDGNARILRARAVRDTGGETPMLTVPGMGPIELARDTSGFARCAVGWVNQSGQVVTRNGMARAGGSGTLSPVPAGGDARLAAGQTQWLTNTDGELESGVAQYHISTVDLRKIMLVSVAVNEGVPPRPATGCAATVVVTYTTL